jgi:hypothetical protein
MIGIIAITAAGSTAITITLLRNIRFNSRLKSKKGEPGGSPFLPFCCVVSEAR